MQQVILASTKLKDFTAYQCVSIQSNATLVAQTTHALKADTDS